MTMQSMKKARENDGHFEKVHAFLRSGKFHDAINFLVNQRTRKLNQYFQDDKNHAWYCVGCAYFELGDFNAAKKAFLNAYRYNPDDIQCLIACGNCFSEMKKPKLAEKILKKALAKKAKKKEEATITYNLGNALFDQGLYDEAIKSYSLTINRRDEIGKLSRKNIIHANGILKKTALSREALK